MWRTFLPLGVMGSIFWLEIYLLVLKGGFNLILDRTLYAALDGIRDALPALGPAAYFFAIGPVAGSIIAVASFVLACVFIPLEASRVMTELLNGVDRD